MVKKKKKNPKTFKMNLNKLAKQGGRAFLTKGTACAKVQKRQDTDP